MDDSFLLEGLNRLMVEAYALPNQADIYKKIEELQCELQRLYAQKNATGERPLSESQLNGLLRTWSNMEFNTEKLRQEVLCISSGPLSLAFHLTNQDGPNAGRFYLTIPLFSFTLHVDSSSTTIQPNGIAAPPDINTELRRIYGLTAATPYGHPHANLPVPARRSFDTVCTGNNHFIHEIRRNGMKASQLVDCLDRWMLWVSHVHVGDCYGTGLVEFNNPAAGNTAWSVPSRCDFRLIPGLCTALSQIVLIIKKTHDNELFYETIMNSIGVWLRENLKRCFGKRADPCLCLETADDESAVLSSDTVPSLEFTIACVAAPLCAFCGPLIMTSSPQQLSWRTQPALVIWHAFTLQRLLYALWFRNCLYVKSYAPSRMLLSCLGNAITADIGFAHAIARTIMKRHSSGKNTVTPVDSLNEYIRTSAYMNGVWDCLREQCGNCEGALPSNLVLNDSLTSLAECLVYGRDRALISTSVCLGSLDSRYMSQLDGINGIELHPEISQALVCREQNMNLRRSDEKYAEAL